MSARQKTLKCPLCDEMDVSLPFDERINIAVCHSCWHEPLTPEKQQRVDESNRLTAGLLGLQAASRRQGVLKGIGGHHRAYRGASDEWLTPKPIIDMLGPFDLDPCAPVVRPWPTTTRHFTIEDDGLSQHWTGRVWLNPPYGPDVGKWLRRLAEHGNGMALVFARTETSWFQAEVWRKASAIFFFCGRLHFCNVKGVQSKMNAGAPSVAIAYGSENAEKLRNLWYGGYYTRIDA